MKKHHNKYLADWRDKKGVRRRKSFDTPETAQAYEDEQKAAVHPKKQGEGQPSLKLSSKSPLAARASTPVGRRKSSSQLRLEGGHRTSPTRIAQRPQSKPTRAKAPSPEQAESVHSEASSDSYAKTTAHRSYRTGSSGRTNPNPET